MTIKKGNEKIILTEQRVDRANFLNNPTKEAVMKMSKKFLALNVLILLSVFLTFRLVMAVTPELNLVFEVKGMDKVTFNGRLLGEQRLKCIDCHPTPFPNKRSAAGTYKMEKMNKGENCGICHNGTKAFKTSDPANCTKCHKK